ncbi:hypothetical protein SOCE26_040190 [Sorangium cellulosum]|uniref:DUF1565 domain-containing protein n=1 Tax=Sorangium cellulosum TaxID=56 RepID=A0A2L0ETF6_SORCE|nr:DUF1565 domain-containing protein [Sorangium cellulosum]AUX42586.1 hypothetical protein SOCE26_040190 [Sorangium cellulosum]
MQTRRASHLSLVLLIVASGCGNAADERPAACYVVPFQGEAPPESVCLERLAAGVLEDGCGVFVADDLGCGHDTNPGTKGTPVRTVQRAVELARTGRGRVFVCAGDFVGPLTLPSGVDLIGGFSCWDWKRTPGTRSVLQSDKLSSIVTVVPASAGDTGAADGVSTIADMSLLAGHSTAMLVRSDTAVEIIRSEIRTADAWGGDWGGEYPPPFHAPDGADGVSGGDACSAAIVAGGSAPVNQCEGGIPSIGGKGGDGLPDGGDDGEDGQPTPTWDPDPDGWGGDGDTKGHCIQGLYGSDGAPGTMGAAGRGIGRISEAGWEGDKGGDGSRGIPGQGGGGGGGRRGGLAACGVASLGGAGGGSGGAGGCGGRGGRGGGNGNPTIGILALHAKVTVRASVITTLHGGGGGAGGLAERGGKGGRGAPDIALADGTMTCGGGAGGTGGYGGPGGPGRGGDSIGIAYLDEDQLTLEDVTFELGPPGKGGISDNRDGSLVYAEDGNAVETQRFPE